MLQTLTVETFIPINPCTSFHRDTNRFEKLLRTLPVGTNQYVPAGFQRTDTK